MSTGAEVFLDGLPADRELPPGQQCAKALADLASGWAGTAMMRLKAGRLWRGDQVGAAPAQRPPRRGRPRGAVCERRGSTAAVLMLMTLLDLAG
jgi:hypothetical protein